MFTKSGPIGVVSSYTAWWEGEKPDPERAA
jgi:hypothetical protein